MTGEKIMGSLAAGKGVNPEYKSWQAATAPQSECTSGLLLNGSAYESTVKVANSTRDVKRERTGYS